MTGYEVIDKELVNWVDGKKVNEIAESIKTNGWNGMPILTYGNVLVTGSHRVAALRKLFDEDFDLSFDCARDITGLVEDLGITEEDLFNNTDSFRHIFTGTWIEQYKEELEW